MTEVGVQELHDHLSEYLHRVQRGEEIVVTNRGQRVVRLIAVTEHRGLDRLVAEGLALPPGRPRADEPEFPSIKTRWGNVSDLVKEQRQ